MRTSPKTNPVMACDYDDEGLSGSVNPSGSGSGSGVVQEDEEEGERKRKRKTNSGGAKKKDGDDTASLLKRIRASLLRRDIWKLTKKRTWKHTGNSYSTSAPSPTALLDLLSSTAAQASDSQPPGAMRDGAIDSIMMSGVSLFLNREKVC
jgi:hypothetical protein